MNKTLLTIVFGMIAISLTCFANAETKEFDLAGISKVEVNNGSGDVSISGLTTGGSVKTGSGKINLVYLTAPTAGELEIKTGSGGAEILLPQTSKIRTSFTAGSGELTNELGDTPNSKFKISMMAGSGNLHIKKSK